MLSFLHYCSIMLNVLGEADGDEGAAAAKQLLDKAYTVPGKITIFWQPWTYIPADSSNIIKHLQSIYNISQTLADKYHSAKVLTYFGLQQELLCTGMARRVSPRIAS